MTQASEGAQIESLLDELRSRYGYDFSAYSAASLKRRIHSAVSRAGCQTIGDLAGRVRNDPSFYKQVISDLTVNVTEMFRDPEVFLAIRRHVVPILRTYPSIRIWHAGCATGEEVYSMAILLKEEGLLERSFLYATDLSPRAIEAAKAGIYTASHIQAYTANYHRSGGVESFSDYYSADQSGVRIHAELKENILFSQHNLVTDDVFSEVHMILCRNVLIYFSPELQGRALGLVRRGLVRRGILVLGTKESMEFTDAKDSFEILHKDERIYRKI
jgi:chemotaxis protein methyltransferase CheR